jgi:hypothetical protein
MNGKSLLLAAASLLAPGLRAEHQDFVVISASASKAYSQHKFADGSPKPESYVLAQGRHFDGATRDPSVDRASFEAIARILAPGLAKQNYLPLRSARFTDADLLIVVHWGTTVTDPMDDKSDFEVQSQLADLVSSIGAYTAARTLPTQLPMGPLHGFSDMNAQLSVSDTNRQAQLSAMNANARLLGYEAALQRENRMGWATPDGMTEEAETHLSQLIDERYFVIVLAFDYQEVQQAKAAGGARHGAARAPRPVWILRMNIRAAGNNFVLALPAMAQAAAGYFGRQMDDLVTAPVEVGSQAHVELGEPRTLNVVK